MTQNSFPLSKGVFHSTFVACSRKSYDKVSIKEHHLRYYPTKESIAASGADHGSSSSVDGETVVISEVMFLAKLNHECIPKLHELFITESSLYLVTNYIDPFRMTNFLDLKEGKTMLHISDVRRIAKSLFSAVAHCHDRGVIVRDLTPQNIMVRKSGIDGNTGGSMKVEVMITDFSLAVQVGSTQTLADHPLFEWNMVPYTAPEALLGHDYSFPMDCWSLGVLIYVMIAGIEPFHHDDDHVLVENIKTASFDFEEDAFDSVDKSVKMLIIDMLRPLPEGRLTVKQALKNAWFSQLNA